MKKQIISCVNPKWIVHPAIEDLCRYNPFYYQGDTMFPTPYFNQRKYFKHILPECHNPSDYFFRDNGLKVPIFIQVSCGDCFCCNETRRQDIAQRLQLEALQHHTVPFWVTLTYSDENLKANELRYSDFQEFIKRLRTRYTENLRFFCVGEFGGETHRVHWHMMLFGHPAETPGQFVKLHDDILESWGNGFIMSRPLNSSDGSFKYVTKYVTKRGQMVQKWSKGLGVQALRQRLSCYLFNPSPTTQPQYLDFFGNLREFRVNRWVLDNVFGSYSRQTYYLRSTLKDYLVNYRCPFLPVRLVRELPRLKVDNTKPSGKMIDKDEKLLNRVIALFDDLDLDKLESNHYIRAKFVTRFDNTLTDGLVSQRETQYRNNYYRRISFSYFHKNQSYGKHFQRKDGLCPETESQQHGFEFHKQLYDQIWSDYTNSE